MRLARILVLGSVLVVGVTAVQTSGASGAPAPKPEMKTLLRAPLADGFTPGREVLVDLVSLPAGATLERHWHPGEEFHYYLEGDPQIHLDGQAPVVGTPGSVGHVPYRAWHKAVGGKQDAKILVFRIHTQGQPLRSTE